MANLDWKVPLLNFRDQIRPLFDGRVEVYHAVVMAPFHRRSMVGAAVRKLQAAMAGKTGIAAIETPTRDCDHHAHYFYGDKGAYVALGSALSGVEDWIQSAPPGLLPKFSIPRKSEGVKRDLVIWTCLVHYLAWKFNLPYLRSVCEFRPLLKEGAIEPWSKWPHQPEAIDLRPLLTHHGEFGGDMEPLKMVFAECDRFCYFPDLIAVQLLNGKTTAEFIGASLAAIDVLVFMLEQVVARDEATIRGSANQQRKTKKADAVIDDTALLIAFLHHYHMTRVTGAKGVPLTTTQIAAAMKWSQSKASRCMKKFLGPNAMAKYRSKFVNGRIHPGFANLLKDGSRVIDAIVSRDHEEDFSEENDLD